MKRSKIAVFFLTSVFLLQATPSFAGASPKQAVSENELRQSYEAFMQYADDCQIPVAFDFESFQAEYSAGNYTALGEYLDTLYTTVDSFSSSAPSPAGDGLLKIPLNESLGNSYSDDYRAGLNYSEELLQAYENFSVSLSDKELSPEWSLENFADGYSQSGYSSVSQYGDALQVEKTASVSSAPAESVSVQSSGSGDRAYYYNIGTTLPTAPNYSKYALCETAQRGDIIFDNEGSNGILGHAAIVEGHFYDSAYGCYYIRVVESIDIGVCRSLLDATRADERASYLYRVKDATDQQKAAAVDFCIDQLGDDWTLNLLHDYSPSGTAWLCSQLVWAGYKNQGIDIECTGGGLPGVMPEDITVNSDKVTEIDCRAGYAGKPVSGDFNGDGRDDSAVFVRKGENRTILKWRSGNSGQTTQAWSSSTFEFSKITDTLVGDFNGDGYDDILAVYCYASNHTIFFLWCGGASGLTLKQGNGTWSNTAFNALSIKDKIVVGDFNGDGKCDIAAFYGKGGTSTSLYEWLGAGTASSPSLTLNGASGTWNSSSFSSSAIGNRIVSGDFNGDGKYDIAVFYDRGSRSTGIYEWFGASGNTGFALNSNRGIWNSTSFSATSINNKILVGDFNGDGNCDIAAFYDIGTSTKLFEWLGASGSTGFTLNGGNGAWSSTSFSASAIMSKVVADDFNGDNKCDIAAFYDAGGTTTKLFEWYGTSSGVQLVAGNGVWMSNTFRASYITGKVVAGKFNKSSSNICSDIAAFYNYGTSISLFEWRGQSSGGLYLNTGSGITVD